MNRLHRWYCRSDHWQRTVARDLIGWTLERVALGDDALEVGAGYGAATAHLRRRAARLTTVDIDSARLRECVDRVGSHDDAGAMPIRAVCADGRSLPFAGDAFSSVVSVAVLHHLDGHESQRVLLREVCRVLRPGGVFAGADAVWTLGFRLFHLGDVFAPVTSEWLTRTLRTIGFEQVDVATRGRYLRWRAHRS